MLLVWYDGESSLVKVKIGWKMGGKEVKEERTRLGTMLTGRALAMGS